MLLDDLREMRCEHGNGIDDSVSVEFRLLALVLRDPKGRQSKRRLNRLNARHFLKDRARVHREIMVEHQLAARNLNAFELDDIGIGLDLDVVADTDGRDDKPEFKRTLPPNHDDAVEQIAALSRIDERDEAVADLEFHRIDLQERDDVLGRRCFFFRLCLLLDLLDFLHRRLTAVEVPRNERAGTGKRKERDARKPGHNGKEEQDARKDHKDAIVAEELLDEVAAEVPLRCRTGHDDTGRRRDEQCRNLRDESLADGEQRVGLECLCRVHVALEHADDEAAADVDHHDDDRRDRIALDEL